MKEATGLYKVNKINLKKAIAFQEKLKAELPNLNTRLGRFQNDNIPSYSRATSTPADKYSPNTLTGSNKYKQDDVKNNNQSSNIHKDLYTPVSFNDAIASIMNRTAPSNSHSPGQIPSAANTMKSVSFNFDPKGTLQAEPRPSENKFSFTDTPDWRLSARQDASIMSTTRYDISNFDTSRLKPPLCPDTSLLESTKRATSLDTQLKKLVLRSPSPHHGKRDSVPGSRDSVGSNTSFEHISRPNIPGITPTDLSHSNPSFQPSPLARTSESRDNLTDRSKSPSDAPAKKHKLLLSSSKRNNNPQGYDSLSSTAEYIANYMSGSKLVPNLSSPVAAYLVTPVYNNPFHNDSRVETSAIRESIHKELSNKLTRSPYDSMTFTPAKSTNITTAQTNPPSANQTIIEERFGRFSEQRDHRPVPFNLSKAITEESANTVTEKQLATVNTIVGSDSKEIASNLVTVPTSSQRDFRLGSSDQEGSIGIDHHIEQPAGGYFSETHNEHQPLSAYQSGPSNASVDIYKRLEEILKGAQDAQSKGRNTPEDRTLTDLSVTNNLPKQDNITHVFIKALQSPSDSLANLVSPPETKKNAEEWLKWGFTSFANKASNEEDVKEPIKIEAQSSKEEESKYADTKVEDPKINESGVVGQINETKSPAKNKYDLKDLVGFTDLVRHGSSLEPKSPQSYLARHESRDTAVRDLSPTKKQNNLPSLPTLSSMSSENVKQETSPTHTAQNIHETIVVASPKKVNEKIEEKVEDEPIKSSRMTHSNSYRNTDHQDSIRQLEEKSQTKQYTMPNNSTNTSYEFSKIYSGLMPSPVRETHKTEEENHNHFQPLQSISEKNTEKSNRSEKDDLAALTEKRLQEMQELFMQKIESVHKDLLHRIELIGVLAAANNNLQPTVAQTLIPELSQQINMLEAQAKAVLGLDRRSSQNSAFEPSVVQSDKRRQSEAETLQLESKESSPKALKPLETKEPSPSRLDRKRSATTISPPKSNLDEISPIAKEKGSSTTSNKMTLSNLQALRDQRKSGSASDLRKVPGFESLQLNQKAFTSQKVLTKPSPEDITPKKQETTPIHKESTPVHKQSTPVNKESTPVNKEYIPITKESSSPLTKDTTPKTRASPPQSKEGTPTNRSSDNLKLELTPIRSEPTPIRSEPVIVKLNPMPEPSECNMSERSERRSDTSEKKVERSRDRSATTLVKNKTEPILFTEHKIPITIPPRDPNLEKKLAAKLGENSPDSKKSSPESKRSRSQTLTDPKSPFASEKILQTIQEITPEPKSITKIDTIPSLDESHTQSKDFGNLSSIAKEPSTEKRIMTKVFSMRDPVLPRDLFLEAQEKKARISSFKETQKTTVTTEKTERETKAPENKTITTELTEQSKLEEVKREAPKHKIKEPNTETIKAGPTISFTETSQNFFAPWKAKDPSPANLKKSQDTESDTNKQLKSPESTPANNLDKSPTKSSIQSENQAETPKKQANSVSSATQTIAIHSTPITPINQNKESAPNTPMSLPVQSSHDEPKKQLQALLKPASAKNLEVKGAQTDFIPEIPVLKKQNTVSTNTFEDLEESYKNPKSHKAFPGDFFANIKIPAALQQRTIDTLEYTDTCLGDGTQRPEFEDIHEEKTARRSPTKDLIDRDDDEDEGPLEGYPQDFKPEDVSQDIFNEPDREHEETLQEYDRLLNQKSSYQPNAQYSKTTVPKLNMDLYRTPLPNEAKIKAALRTLSPDRIVPSFPKTRKEFGQRGVFTGIRELSDSSKKDRSHERSPLQVVEKSPIVRKEEKSSPKAKGKDKSPARTTHKALLNPNPKENIKKKMKIEVPDRSSLIEEDTPQFGDYNPNFESSGQKEKENESKLERKKSRKDGQIYRHFLRSNSSQVNLESLKQGLVEKSKLLSKFYYRIKPLDHATGETEEESDASKLKRTESRGSIRAKGSLKKSKSRSKTRDSDFSADSRKMSSEESMSDIRARHERDEEERRLRSEIKELRNKLKFYAGNSYKYVNAESPVSKKSSKLTKSPSMKSKESKESDKSATKTPKRGARPYKDSPMKTKKSGEKSKTPKKSRNKSPIVESFVETDFERIPRKDSNTSLESSKEYSLTEMKAKLAARTKLMEEAIKKAAQTKIFLRSDSEEELSRSPYHVNKLNFCVNFIA